MTSPDQLDGGVDEQDRDSTEAELAAAIAALLAAKAAGAPWLSLVQGSLSGIVQDYLRRSAYAMAVAAGMTSTESAQAADEATAAVLGDVERHSAEWLKISADDHAEKAAQAADEPGPEPGAPPTPKALPVQAPGKPMTPDDAKTAGNLIAASLATYSRERVREDIAKKLGAEFKTWTSRGDQAVRPAHRTLAGQTKRLDKPFSVDGSDIMRPGDPEAPPELVLNCRCHLRFSVKPV
jgi:hypothetical protein